MKPPSEKRTENMIVIVMRTPILKKNTIWQANIMLPDPAVVMAPPTIVLPIFSAA